MKKKLIRKNNSWSYKWRLELIDWFYIGVVVLTVAFMLYLLKQIIRG